MIGIFFLQRLQLFDVFGLTVADDDERCIEIIEQPRCRGYQQIGPFLFHQSAYRAKQRPSRKFTARFPVEHPEQGLPVGLSAGLAILDTVMSLQVRIRGRVPDMHINTVDDAAQLVPVIYQHAVHALPEFRREDFICITSAHRGDRVGVNQAGLEQ